MLISRAVLAVYMMFASGTAPANPPMESAPIYFTDRELATPTPMSGTEPDWSVILPLPVTVTLTDPQVIEYVWPEYSLPVDYDTTNRGLLASPHHDYPAADINMPVGNNVYAMRGGLVVSATPSDGGACGGKVTIQTDIGVFLYCHLSAVKTAVGAQVMTGEIVALSGGRPGAYGSGSARSPHLHMQLSRNGRLVCPQPLLLSLWDETAPNLSDTTRCIG